MARSLTFRNGVALAAVAFWCSACFTVQHELPPHSYFGKLPPAVSAAPGARTEAFDQEASKNWALAGLVAYSDFGVKDLAPASDPATGRLENVEVETRFSEFDVLISIIPGLAYGYYLWAPRTVRIKGRRVEE